MALTSSSPSLVIYIDADTRLSYTYAQVKNAAIDFGKGLKGAWEWQKGDVLALFTPNSIDMPVVTWGTHWAGGIISPANPGYTADELTFQLKDSGAKALCTQLPMLKTALTAARNAGISEDRIILLGDDRDPAAKFKHFSSIRNTAGTNRYRKAKIKPKEDLAFLVYSSGTTGHPKGVMLSHENIVSNVMMGRAGEGGNLAWDGGPDGTGDNILAFLPFFHIYGKSSLQAQSNEPNNIGRPYITSPSSDIQRSHNNRHGQIRSRKILFTHTKFQNHLLLYRSSSSPPARKASHHRQVRSQ